MSRAELIYTAASTNRFFQAAHVSPDGVVAFGSAKLVALWDTEDSDDRGVYETLPGHDGAVTCICFATSNAFVSADEKGVMRWWRKQAAGTQWRTCATQQAHKGGISSLALHGRFVVTGASDSLVKVWLVPEEETDAFQEVQTINIRKGFPISLALAELPGTQSVLLAVGSTDRSIHLWTGSEGTFVQAAILSGHEDWVKSLAFRLPQNDSEALVLASGSQDATIRLWNIEPFTKPNFAPSGGSTSDVTDELLDAFEASLVSLEDTEDGRQISLKRHILTVKTAQNSSQLFSVTFDALLIGHEAGVTSLTWRTQNTPKSLPTLLSTSTDSSLILWSPSTVLTSATDGTTLWINRQRFGDIGGQRLGGFVGGLWARGGSDALAWGWNGGWRRWRCESPEADKENTMEDWTEVGAITGHRAPVRSVAWSPGGEYLISASLDQTTRIHGAIPTARPDGTSILVWHEIGRPQVHGYDLIGAAFLDPLRFVSIADEKVARVFEAPREFVDVVSNLHIADLDSGEENRPRAAAVPPLGLSNKALTDVSAVAEVNGDSDDARTRRRPFEGELAATTLWPEVEKVFGHGYESIALAVSNNKEYVATACKATSADHAVVRIYETQTWQPVGEPLAGHNLTVTQIAFSPDDSLVLSVSRDRTWRLFEKSEEGYVPVAADKSHGRIIWDCAWVPEGDVFATASRDKTVKIWKRQSENNNASWTAVATIAVKAAATAVAFAPTTPNSQSRALAVGLESGEILLHTSSRDDPSQWTCTLTIDTSSAHVDHIHRLAWRPAGDHGVQQLASCGEDGTLKLLTVHIAGQE